MAARISLSPSSPFQAGRRECCVCVRVYASATLSIERKTSYTSMPFPESVFLEDFSLSLPLRANLGKMEEKRGLSELEIRRARTQHTGREREKMMTTLSTYHWRMQSRITRPSGYSFEANGHKPRQTKPQPDDSGPSRQQQPMPLYAPENNKEKKKKAAVEKCFPPRSILTNRAYIYVLETCVLRSCGRGEKLVRSPRTFDSYLALVAYQHGSSTLSEIDTK